MSAAEHDGGRREGAGRRERILDAAASLFGGRDLSLVTMDEVASRAGVAKGTLYNYFSSKEDLYFSIIVGRMRHLLDALREAFREEEDARVRLRKFVVHTLQFLLKYPDFFRMLRKEETRLPAAGTGDVRDLRSGLRDLLRSVLESGIEEGSIRTIPPDLAVDLILGALEGTALRCIARGRSARRHASEPDALFDFVWRSICSGPIPAGSDLAGMVVLVTREEGPGEGLGAEVERLGGRAMRVGVLATAPPADPEPLRRAAAGVASHDWVLFTSARGVEAFFDAWRDAGSPAIPCATRFGAVGEATAERICARFGGVDLEAEEMSGEGLAASLGEAGPVSGARILIPRALDAHPELPRLLRARGASVEEVVAYRTVPAPFDPDPIREMLRRGEIAAVTFASPSAARSFVERVGIDWYGEGERRARVVSIGPTTSAALRSLAIAPDEEAVKPRMAELARAAARAVHPAGRGTIAEAAASPGGTER